MRQFGDHGFRLSSCLEVARVIGKANNAVGVRDIDPFGSVAREERDAKGLIEAARVNLAGRGFMRLAIGRAQNPDTSGAGFRDEDVAIGRHAHLARSAQALGEQRDLEAGGHLRERSLRTRHHMRHVGGGGRCSRLRQVFRPDQPAHAGSVGAPVAERGVAGQRRRLRHRLLDEAGANGADGECEGQPVQRAMAENHKTRMGWLIPERYEQAMSS